jgi:hypothetical protein
MKELLDPTVWTFREYLFLSLLAVSCALLVVSIRPRFSRYVCALSSMVLLCLAFLGYFGAGLQRAGPPGALADIESRAPGRRPGAV